MNNLIKDETLKTKESIEKNNEIEKRPSGNGSDSGKKTLPQDDDEGAEKMDTGPVKSSSHTKENILQYEAKEVVRPKEEPTKRRQGKKKSQAATSAYKATLGVFIHVFGKVHLKWPSP